MKKFTKLMLAGLLMTSAAALACSAAACAPAPSKPSTPDNPDNDDPNPPAAHEHLYTEWEYGDNEHWLVCPDDGAIDETSRESHGSFPCECGKQGVSKGTVNGQISLIRLGEKMPFDASLAMVDYNGQTIAVNAQGRFSVPDVEILSADNFGLLSITYPGYTSYYYLPDLTTDGEVRQLDIELMCEVLELSPLGWGKEGQIYDGVSKNGEINITIDDQNDGLMLNCLTKESYATGSAQIYAKPKTSYVAAWAQFDSDKKFVGVACNGTKIYWLTSPVTGNVTYVSGVTGDIKTLSNTEKAQYQAGNLKIGFAREGSKIHVLMNDMFITTKDLGTSYASSKAKFGYVCGEVMNDNFFVDLKTEYSATDITIDNQDAMGIISLDKTTANLGETVTVSYNANGAYAINSVKIGGCDVAATLLSEGTYTFKAGKDTTITVDAVEKVQITDLNATVYKLVTGYRHRFANGTAVTLSRPGQQDVTLTVQNGKLQLGAATLYEGEYTVSVTGLNSATIELKNGVASSCELFGATVLTTTGAGKGIDAALHDLSKEKEGIITVKDNTEKVGDETLNVISTEGYDVVMAEMTAKLSNSNTSWGRQGVWLKFADGKYAALSIWADGKVNWMLPYGKNLDGGADGLEAVHTCMAVNEESKKWSGTNICILNDAQKSKFTSSSGIKIQLARNGNVLIALLDGEYIDSLDLDASYADDKVQAGFWAWAPGGGKGASFNVAIKQMEMGTITVPAAVNGTVSITAGEKPAYNFGDKISFKVTPNSGYIITSFMVGDSDYSFEANEAYKNGSDSFDVIYLGGNVDAVATFERDTIATGTVKLTGKKLGKSVAFGKETIALLTSNTGEYYIYLDANGNGAFGETDEIHPGKYTLTVVRESPEGRMIMEYDTVSVTINAGSNSITKSLNWSGFTAVGKYNGTVDSGAVNFSQVNSQGVIMVSDDAKYKKEHKDVTTLDGQKITASYTGMCVETKAAYDVVTASMIVNENNSATKASNVLNEVEQGIALTFTDDNGKITAFNVRVVKSTSGNYSLQIMSSAYSSFVTCTIDGQTVPPADKDNFPYKGLHTFTAAQIEALSNADRTQGIEFSMCRVGLNIYLLLDGVKVGPAIKLDSKYEDQLCQVAFFSYVAQGCTYYVDVTDVVPAAVQ